jgi:predicted Zn-dependent protease
MSGTAEPVGTLEVALKNALRLLDARPDLGAEQAQEILRSVPAHPMALLILGSAHRRQQAAAAALAVLDPLVEAHPKWGAAYYEQALALAMAGQGEAALKALRQAVALEPNLTDAWRALADHLRASGDQAAADAAAAQQIKAATRDPRLLQAAQALIENRIPSAETLLRKHLLKFPTDVAAIRMLAEVAARLRRYHDASLLLERALELAPGFSAARQNYAVVLHREARASDALREVNRLLTEEPGNPGYRNLKAVVLGALGDYSESLQIYEQLLAEYPNQPKAWISYGHALKTAGRSAECIAAYRRTLALAPTMGEAYWSLANLKTFCFEATDLAAIRGALARTDLAEEDRACFEFALGKALEDQADYHGAFEQYAAGNRRRKAQLGYEASEMSGLVARSRTLLTPQFFAERAGFGAQAPDPIFIVGLPRAGSTLIEQILASHPQVEGTMELPDMIAIVRALTGARSGPEDTPYPDLLGRLSAERCLELGNQYLERTRPQRKRGAPFFIDKMPNNFAHLGLIQLLLPKARIIDARRHPLGCCFSAYKQYFARGQSFSYSLEDLGRYYRDYVELMAHFDAVLPGRVHRVIYERLVADTEAEVRSLLAFCDLPFDERCLKFYENERAVRTASSEQVRKPIYREGLDHWRHFEAYLEPLKSALGSVLECYPAVPEFPSPLTGG